MEIKQDQIKADKSSKLLLDSDPIKITDQEGVELSYSTLDVDEKEKVLGDLLFQSALQNIALQQIVNFF